mmetsp:Transcript_27998/g.50162  ORF Transcript_27998/g.50162 Transcript_27998/m.50162 type:complete len:591 (-) Transcript_27998:1-1773(-)
MEIEEYMLIFYPVVCFIPIAFIIYATVHFSIHWKDGIQRGRVQFSRSQCAKRTLSGTLAIGSMINVIGGFTQMQSTDDEIALSIRAMFFSIQSLAWVISCFLVPFNYNRRIHSPWFGQRLFVPMSGIVYICLCVLEGFVIRPQHFNFKFEVLQLCSYALNTVLTIILTFIITVRPDDFFITKASFNKRASIKSFDYFPPELDSSKLLNVEISDVKTKVGLDQAPFVLYSITVKIPEAFITTKRTYSDFYSLHEYIEKKFNFLPLPTLPKFESKRDDVSHRMTQLSNYLEAVTIPEVMCNELLDFLGVLEPHRTTLLELSHQLLVRKQSAGRHDTFDCSKYFGVPKFTMLTPFLKVSIDQWEDYDNYVRYFINWHVPQTSTEGTAKMRYNDLYNLHNGLKSLIFPGKLPTFPSRSIFALGEDSIKQRAHELQTYIKHITNDPAYLNQELLSFLGCDAGVEALWRKAYFNKLNIVFFSWESSKSIDDKLQIVYVIKLERPGDIDWTIRRRYSEFFDLNKSLIDRSASPLLLMFMDKMKLIHEPLPHLPKKTVIRMTNADDIEGRKRGLEAYLGAFNIQGRRRLLYQVRTNVA